ncbi:hypothetical protein [Streptomyces sp. 039-1]|uniref:hypothetical protein n=1 Tax=Streptomyces sp. 039-1 TaxID=2789263 RepID=UPI0039F529EA
MNEHAGSRLDRVRGSLGIAQLALQQVEDEFPADSADELAMILRELHADSAVPGGFLPALAQLIRTIAHQVERVEPGYDGDASCPLHEAAALLGDDIGLRLTLAARSLYPQGDTP